MATLKDAIALSEAGRNDEAVQIVRQIAASGDPDGLYMLAEMTWRGGMVPQEPVRARTLYEYAAALGHAGAGVIVTNLTASGVAGARDWPTALQRLELEAAHYPQRRAALDLIRAMALDGDGNPRALPEPRRISERPDARVFERLLTAAECGYLIDVASASFEPSMVFNQAREWVRDEIRTSDGAAIHWLIEDPAIHALNRRFAAITASAYESGEALQVLRYSPGQEYRPHFDFVDKATNRRLWTALAYLNGDYEGGATAFVRTDVAFRGGTGDVLLFGNAAPDGGPEPLAEHAGLPVTRGTKYLATRWVREGRWIP